MSSPALVPHRAFLFADPAAHSLSPVMHRAAFGWAGLRGEYVAERIPAPELPARLATLRRDPAALGANLSLPHKESALPLLDSLSDAARQIGAVNTVVRRGSELHGENTDAPGLLAALLDAGFASPGGPVVVLGAGGAARAAVYTALISLERDVYVVNRSRARAEELAAAWFVPQADFQVQDFQVRAATLAEVPWSQISLIINCTSAGLDDPQGTPLPDFDFRCSPQAGVYDMVYRPAETRLLREARAAGLSAHNGLGMLAHQARLAFQAWTRVDVPAQVFLRALGGAQP
ncbi:shikimate dehydrogenase family protein [Deinococcus fonticola]|uniref:shikimate dehydrogenase family protein n=1 Tax=Deinococcus fonticola TaxID=2528713 RepID=UPI001F110EE7|nr:shikimate dehydrogenase [Deinococcus fonticola]